MIEETSSQINETLGYTSTYCDKQEGKENFL